MNQGIAEQRLRELGIELPRASRPAAKYANFVIVNGLMFISGKGPTSGAKGKLGETYTTEELLSVPDRRFCGFSKKDRQRRMF